MDRYPDDAPGAQRDEGGHPYQLTISWDSRTEHIARMEADLVSRFAREYIPGCDIVFEAPPAELVDAIAPVYLTPCERDDDLIVHPGTSRLWTLPDVEDRHRYDERLP